MGYNGRMGEETKRKHIAHEKLHRLQKNKNHKVVDQTKSFFFDYQWGFFKKWEKCKRKETIQLYYFFKEI